MSDIEGWLIETVPVNDGIWSLYGIDDDRPIAAWSAPHYDRALSQVAIAHARVAAAEWAHGDLAARGAGAALLEKAERTLSAAKASLAEWEAQKARIEGAR